MTGNQRLVVSRLLGGRKPVLPAGRPPGTVSPWPGHQLACVCAHANTDTDEEPTMTQLSSKIEPPPDPVPRGAWMLVPHCSHYSNTEPAPFNPGARKRDRAGAGGRDGAGRRRAGHGSGYHGPFRIKTEHGLAARCAAAASPLRALLAPGGPTPLTPPKSLSGLPVVRAEVVLLQRDGFAGPLAEGVGLRLGVGTRWEGR